MGNRSSKSQLAMAKSPEKKHQELDVAISPAVEAFADSDGDAPPPHCLLDPRSPYISRTPLVKVSGQSSDSAKALRINLNAETPSNLLRKRLVRDIGLKYTANEMHLLDPRSPSACIPRTPLLLTLNDDNSSLAGDSTRGASRLISLEYTGLLEEASCRYFNEKLSNITLDDSDYVDVPEAIVADDEFRDGQLAEIRRKYLETNFEFDGDEIKLKPERDPRSPSVNIYRTPFVLTPKMDATDVSAIDNVSPIIITDENGEKADKHHLDNYPVQMFSSTPTVQSTVVSKEAGLLKTKNLGKIIQTRIYEDEPEQTDNSRIMSKSSETLMTPVKRFGKLNGNDDKPRTPLSTVNRRTKSAESVAQRQSKLRVHDDENDENAQSNVFNDENSVNMHCTPRRPALNVNKNRLSIRSSSSKIPVARK